MAEPDFLCATRASYDILAVDYQKAAQNAVAEQPLERGLLAAFAELASGGRVVDVGCGTGEYTAHLHKWAWG